MSTNSIDTEQITINPDNAGFGTGASDIIVPKTGSMFGKSNEPFIMGMDENKPKTIDDKVPGATTIEDGMLSVENTGSETLLTELAKELPKTESESGIIEETEEGSAEVKNQGRPKTDKNALANYIKSKVESKEFELWEDYDEKVPVEDYLNSLPEKELNSLLDTNLTARDQKREEELRKEVFESLPGSLQYIAAAVANGATEHDLQDVLQAVLRVEQTRALDITDENDQEAIAYSYLQATNFGNQAEIQEQVEEWKNDGKLEGKVKQFKPKLDQMSEQQVQYQLQQQEEYNRQQAEMQQYYTQSIVTTLKKGEVGGLKLDKKRQQEFYNGLTNVHQSPLSGKPVNSLGARLEEIQFSDKPDFDLLMEVNWLLNDKEGYRNALIQLGKNEGVVETEKKLKSAQISSSKGAYEEPEKTTGIKKGLRKQASIF